MLPGYGPENDNHIMQLYRWLIPGFDFPYICSLTFDLPLRRVLFKSIKQLVSNIGIFAQKSQVFNGPLHFKDNTPSPLCLSMHMYMCGVYMHAIKMSHRWKSPGCTHSERMTVSIISRWDIVFNMTYTLQQT